MKLPEYISTGKSNMTYCSAVINDELAVVSGDEYLYNFLGKLIGISLYDFIHPDYIDELKEICSSVAVGEVSRVMLPILDAAKEYRWVDILVSNTGRTVEEVRVLDIQIYNVLNMENKYMTLANDANKYRSYLSMYKNYYFDYDVENDCFTVFRYMSLKATILIKCRLEEFHECMQKFYEKEEDRNEFEKFYQNIAGSVQNFDCVLKAPDVKNHSVLQKISIEGKVLYKYNKQRMVIGIVTVLGESNDNLPYYSTAAGKDSATGLLNKRACNEYIRDAIAANNEKHYLAVVDIDNFKNINDTYGHLFGDEVIEKIAIIMSSCLNGRGIVGRFGGDEFLIFTNWIKTEEQFRAVLTSMRQKIFSAFEQKGKDIHITLSVGISQFPDDGNAYEELFEKADRCLYIAKNKGKNRYIIYNPKVHSDVVQEEKLIRVKINTLDKAELLADIMLEISECIYGRKFQNIVGILDGIRKSFEIDGIRIYGCDRGEPLCVSGDYTALPDIADYVQSGHYLSLFGGKHSLVMGNINHFENVCKEYYDATFASNIISIASYTFKDSRENDVFFFYDIFNHPGRWSDSDINYLLAISKLLIKAVELMDV